MRISNTEDNYHKEHLYFLASDLYLGDKHTAYGNTLSINMNMYIPDLLNDTVTYINSTLGDVILQGKYTKYSLINQLPEVLSENATNFSVSCNNEMFN